VGEGHVTIEDKGQWRIGTLYQFDHFGDVFNQLERTFGEDELAIAIINKLVAEANEDV
jgi:hypothetical protein